MPTQAAPERNNDIPHSHAKSASVVRILVKPPHLTEDLLKIDQSDIVHPICTLFRCIDCPDEMANWLRAASPRFGGKVSKLSVAGMGGSVQRLCAHFKHDCCMDPSFQRSTPAARLHKALSNPQLFIGCGKDQLMLQTPSLCGTANGLQAESQMLLLLAFDQSATSSTDIAELQMFVFRLQPLGSLHDSSPLCACPVMPAFGACYSIMPLLSLPSDSRSLNSYIRLVRALRPLCS